MLIPALAAEPARQLVDIAIGPPPASVATAGGSRLVYEAHVTSFADVPLRLERLRVLAGDGRRVLAVLEADQLASAMRIVGGGEPPRLEPGRRAVLYLDLAQVESRRGERIAHELTVSDIATGASASVVGGATQASATAPPVLGPPLRGGPWAALYDPALANGHRRVFYATDGAAVLPGRFAVDFVAVSGDGARGTADGDDPARLPGYAEPVLAVADGTVAAVRDDVPDPPTRSGRGRPAIGDASGNYIALDIGGGRYVFYEHLKRGITVGPGQRVRRGQVIAAIGFTGQASEPHLHLHVADRPSVLGAEGAPFVLSAFAELGRYPSIAAFGRRERWLAGNRPAAFRKVMPGPNTVIRFDGR